MHEEDIAALQEPTLDADESVYWTVDLEYAQGEFEIE
jgi:hypothetical protein